MPDWLLWAAAIVLAVAAGWAWHDRRGSDRRAADRPPRRPGARPGRRTPPGGPGRSATPPRPRTAEGSPARTPRPGEIWWADVPYAEGTGSKVRPCLVLRADDGGADVLKITSQDKSARDDHVRIPTREWDPDADHDSFVDLAEPAHVPLAGFARHAGACDAALWQRIRRLPHLPGA
ncbi:type II toxin-antitoxin system PemK/MazF family toxin [Micromonospora sp. KLBMP9576]|uniref:type II toxin-antitoxin system PemK/MazF family toxin n=1 Tax=Micromonospora sp. KLBMP9576 TaxID=3424769 RepID=UPI003D92EE32